MGKKNIAVVMGGYSDEYKVSIKSGQLIYNELDRNLYNVYRVHILTEGWFFLDNQDQYHPINKADFSVKLSNNDILRFDVCFNIIHGIPGENGIMQAYWDSVGQKYTGCGPYQSALTFNKKDTLAVLSKYGISSAKSIYLKEGDAIDEDKILSDIGIPCFVKPNQSGSSLGISKVSKKEQLKPALEKAFTEDSNVLIEEFLDGMEVSVGVVDYGEKLLVLGITEIISENDFFDYEAKYGEGKAKEITPARIDETTKKVIEDIAVRAYSAIGMSGFSRSEYILVNNIPYMLEMNTNPGFSPTSILPQQAEYYGISIKDLCGNEVEKAMKKHRNLKLQE